MAIEYRLTIASDSPVNQLAERALPEPGDRPTGAAPLLSADLYERYGFDLSIRSGSNGYVDALSDGGDWEWEPPTFISTTFRMDKFADPTWSVINMLTIVRRVLWSGPEDAALIFNGDVLLLARFDGELVKHQAAWWSSYPGADQLIPDVAPA